jgi:hypothetical protein
VRRVSEATGSAIGRAGTYVFVRGQIGTERVEVRERLVELLLELREDVRVRGEMVEDGAGRVGRRICQGGSETGSDWQTRETGAAQERDAPEPAISCVSASAVSSSRPIGWPLSSLPFCSLDSRSCGSDDGGFSSR